MNETDHAHAHAHGLPHEHDGHAHGPHGHTHEKYEGPGLFRARPPRRPRDFGARAFTVGIGGPVGSGKTALVLAMCRKLRDTMRLGVVTNDIFTREDAEFLHRNEALPAAQIRAVETGGCEVHELAAVLRGEVVAAALDEEQLGRNIAHQLLERVEVRRDVLADGGVRAAYVVDVAGGDKVPRKGGPGVTQSDLLIVNKIDLAVHVGASLDVMARDASRVRQGGPVVFCRCNIGEGVDEVIGHILAARAEARSSSP